MRRFWPITSRLVGSFGSGAGYMPPSHRALIAYSYPIDPFLVTSKLTPDSLLSHHAALEFHGKAYSVHTHLTYSATRPLRHLTFHAHLFRGTRFPQALLREGKIHVGVLTAERAGMELRVASLERTLVDVLDRPDLSGSREEIWRSLQAVEFFDLDKVVEYALLLENATTGPKVGFFLEQHREPLMVEDLRLKALHDLRPRQLHYLDRAKRTSGPQGLNYPLTVSAAQQFALR